MQKNEIIRLDGRVVDVIANAVFHAQLENGHVLVAFCGPGEQAAGRGLRPGDRIKMDLSPYDMSCGRIIRERELEYDDESEKLGETNM